MRKSVTVIAAAAMTLGVAPATGADASSDHARPHRTTIVLKIDNCKGCKIRPSQFHIDGPAWLGKNKLVRKHKVVFRVPSAHTRGLTFELDDPRPTGLEANPVIVTRYRGQSVGSTVTNAEARTAKMGSPCWVGSRRDRVVKEVAVRRFETGKGVRGTRVWFRKTAKSTRPYTSTFHGVIAIQDHYPCN